MGIIKVKCPKCGKILGLSVNEDTNLDTATFKCTTCNERYMVKNCIRIEDTPKPEPSPVPDNATIGFLIDSSQQAHPLSVGDNAFGASVIEVKAVGSKYLNILRSSDGTALINGTIVCPQDQFVLNEGDHVQFGQAEYVFSLDRTGTFTPFQQTAQPQPQPQPSVSPTPPSTEPVEKGRSGWKIALIAIAVGLAAALLTFTIAVILSPDTGDTDSASATADTALADSTDTDTDAIDEDLQEGLKEANAELPSQVDEGVMLESITLEDDFVVFNVTLDEDQYPLEEFAKNRSFSRELIQGLSAPDDDGAENEFATLLKEYGKGIAVRYKGESSGDTYTVRMSSEELFGEK